MLAFNKKECFKRMIESGEYQTQKNRIKEEEILIYFLTKEGKSEDEIYDIWYKFYIKRAEYTVDDDNPRGTFSDIKDSALSKNWLKSKEKHKTIIIYRDEIDKINSLDCARWIKEYTLLLIAYIKMNDYEYIESINTSLLRHIKRPKSSKADCANVCKVLINGKILKPGVRYTKKDQEIELDENGYPVSITYIKETKEEKPVYDYCLETNSNEIVIKTDFIFDMFDYFDLIKMEKVCTCCGKKFEYNTKTKRDICKECWNKKRTLDFEDYIDNRRVDTRKKHYTIKVDNRKSHHRLKSES